MKKHIESHWPQAMGSPPKQLVSEPIAVQPLPLLRQVVPKGQALVRLAYRPGMPSCYLARQKLGVQPVWAWAQQNVKQDGVCR